MCDNDPNKWGKEYEGLPCVSPAELKNYKNVVVIIMMGNPLPVQQQLDQMGIVWVTHVDLSLDDTMDIPTDVEWFKQEIAKMKEAYKLFEDEESQKVYANAICNRIAYPIANCSWQEMCTSGEYFSQSFMPMTDSEIYVDCGAYNGDTVLRFLSEVWKYEEIHAFEMDRINFEEMKRRVVDKSNIYFYCKGVWRKNKIISYGYGRGINELRAGISIMKSKDGVNSFAEVVKLDTALRNIDVTFMKMDIERVEMEALGGAREILRERKPKLAICVYHKISDFWNIPLLLKEICPQYRVRLRHHYNINSWGTVLYAYC